MILHFNPGIDLIDFIWNAATATASVANVNPLYVLSSGNRGTEIVQARRLLILLAGRGLWSNRRNPMGRNPKVFKVAIWFGKQPPERNWRRASAALLGNLMGLDHVTILNARVHGPLLRFPLKQAEAVLREMYPDNPIVVNVSFTGGLKGGTPPS